MRKNKAGKTKSKKQAIDIFGRSNKAVVEIISFVKSGASNQINEQKSRGNPVQPRNQLYGKSVTKQQNDDQIQTVPQFTYGSAQNHSSSLNSKLSKRLYDKHQASAQCLHQGSGALPGPSITAAAPTPSQNKTINQLTSSNSAAQQQQQQPKLQSISTSTKLPPMLSASSTILFQSNKRQSNQQLSMNMLRSNARQQPLEESHQKLHQNQQFSSGKPTPVLVQNHRRLIQQQSSTEIRKSGGGDVVSVTSNKRQRRKKLNQLHQKMQNQKHESESSCHSTQQFFNQDVNFDNAASGGLLQRQQKASSTSKHYMQPLKRPVKVEADRISSTADRHANDANSILRSISAIQSKHPNLKIDLKHASNPQMQQTTQFSYAAAEVDQWSSKAQNQIVSASSGVKLDTNQAQNSDITSSKYLDTFKSPQETYIKSKNFKMEFNSQHKAHHLTSNKRQITEKSSAPDLVEEIDSARSNQSEIRQRMIASEQIIKSIIKDRESGSLTTSARLLPKSPPQMTVANSNNLLPSRVFADEKQPMDEQQARVDSQSRSGLNLLTQGHSLQKSGKSNQEQLYTFVENKFQNHENRNLTFVSISKQKEGQFVPQSQSMLHKGLGQIQAEETKKHLHRVENVDAGDLEFQSRNMGKIQNMHKSIEKMRANKQITLNKLMLEFSTSPERANPAAIQPNQSTSLMQINSKSVQNNPSKMNSKQQLQPLQNQNQNQKATVGLSRSRLFKIEAMDEAASKLSSGGRLPCIQQNSTNAEQQDKWHIQSVPDFQIPKLKHSKSQNQSPQDKFPSDSKNQREKIRQIIGDQRQNLIQNKTRQIGSLQSFELEDVNHGARSINGSFSPQDKQMQTPSTGGRRNSPGALGDKLSKLVTNFSQKTMISDRVKLAVSHQSQILKSQDRSTNSKNNLVCLSKERELALVQQDSLSKIHLETQYANFNPIQEPARNGQVIMNPSALAKNDESIALKILGLQEDRTIKTLQTQQSLSKKLSQRLQEVDQDKAAGPPLQGSMGIYTEITSPAHPKNYSAKLLASNSQSSPHTAQFKKRSTLFYAEHQKSDHDLEVNSQSRQTQNELTAQIISSNVPQIAVKDKLTKVDKLRMQAQEAQNSQAHHSAHNLFMIQQQSDDMYEKEQYQTMMLDQHLSSKHPSKEQQMKIDSCGAPATLRTDAEVTSVDQMVIDDCGGTKQHHLTLSAQKNSSGRLANSSQSKQYLQSAQKCKSAKKNASSFAIVSRGMVVNEYTDEDKSSLLRSGMDCMSLPQISDRETNQLGRGAPTYKAQKKLKSNSQSKCQQLALSRGGPASIDSNASNPAAASQQLQVSCSTSAAGLVVSQQHSASLAHQQMQMTNFQFNSLDQRLHVNQQTSSGTASGVITHQKSNHPPSQPQVYQQQHNAQALQKGKNRHRNGRQKLLNSGSSNNKRSSQAVDTLAAQLNQQQYLRNNANTRIKKTSIDSGSGHPAAKQQQKVTISKNQVLMAAPDTSLKQSRHHKAHTGQKQNIQAKQQLKSNEVAAEISFNADNLPNYFNMEQQSLQQTTLSLHQRNNSIKSSKAEKDKLIKNIMQNNRQQILTTTNPPSGFMKSTFNKRGSFNQTLSQQCSENEVGSMKQTSRQKSSHGIASKIKSASRHDIVSIDAKNNLDKQSRNEIMSINQQSCNMPNKEELKVVNVVKKDLVKSPQPPSTQQTNKPPQQPQTREFVSKPAQITFSVKLLKFKNNAAESNKKTQCIGLCFEGLCASVNLASFAYSDQNQHNLTQNSEMQNADAYIRDNLREALDSFRTATKNAVCVFLYTFLSENHPLFECKELASFFDELDRVIFIKGCYRYSQSYTRQQLEIPRELLPEQTSEILWIHPFDMDFNEVLQTIKTKNYQRLLRSQDGVRISACLPTCEPQILQHSLLVSSIEFDLSLGQSASMLAIMKTVQSLYFLGKTHLILQKSKLQLQQQAPKQSSLVPAAIQVGLVPAPAIAPAQATGLQAMPTASSKPVISYSWQKSFKTIQEHMLLSLVAFEAPESCFNAQLPTTSPNQSHLELIGKRGSQAPLSSNISLTQPATTTLPASASNFKGSQQNQYQKLQNRVLMNFKESNFDKKKYLTQSGLLEPNTDVLAKMQPTSQILDLVQGANTNTSTISYSQYPNKPAMNQIKDNAQSVTPLQSYQQHTISSGINALANQNQGYSAGEYNLIVKDQLQQMYISGVGSQQLTHQQLLVVSPKNQARQFLKELRQQNNQIARSIRTYARAKDQIQQVKRDATNIQQSADRTTQNNDSEDQKETQQSQRIECRSRNIFVLDGWLIEKYPLLKLTL